MDNVRWWGWTIQLYAARSSNSWGIGDFADLRDFATFASADGARFGIVNPLHAGLPSLPQEPSPYFQAVASFATRFTFVSKTSPASKMLTVLIDFTQEGRALNSERLIPRDDIYLLKMEALRMIFAVTTLGDDFYQYV